MAAKLFLDWLTKIAIQLHLVAECCIICISRSRRPVRKLLDTPLCVLVNYINSSRTVELTVRIVVHKLDEASKWIIIIIIIIIIINFLSFRWFLNSRHGPQPNILKGLFSYYWDINFRTMWQVPKLAGFCSSIYTLCDSPVSLRELNIFLGTMPVADTKIIIIIICSDNWQTLRFVHCLM
jgi:hypothetical protein